MVTKSSRVILCCLISIVLVNAASATWVPLTGEPCSISSLLGKSLIFGDKEFSEIELFGIGTGGAVAPNADSVFVQGGQDNVTGNYGLRFQLAGNAGSNQTANANLSFKISILPDYPGYFVNDVEMILSGVSANGTGVVNVSEAAWDAFPGGSVVALLSCSKQAGDNDAHLVDHAEFDPLKEIRIQSKDISISGGTGIDGAAHLSEFFQFYSQVPEPMTVCLLGVGALSLVSRKRNA